MIRNSLNYLLLCVLSGWLGWGVFHALAGDTRLNQLEKELIVNVTRDASDHADFKTMLAVHEAEIRINRESIADIKHTLTDLVFWSRWMFIGLMCYMATSIGRALHPLIFRNEGSK